MSVQVSATLPDDIMAWLVSTAEENFRTPEGQLLWLLQNTKTRSEQHRQDSEAAKQLNHELRKLHLDAGQPSIRAIAGRIDRQGSKTIRVSHTSVHNILQGKRVPSWAMVEAIVTALGGNRPHFKKLWMQAKGAK